MLHSRYKRISFLVKSKLNIYARENKMKTFRNFFSGFGLLLLSFNLSAENLHVFKYEEKFGYFNDNLEVQIEPIYDDASDFNDGYATVKHKPDNNKINTVYYVINEQNEVESSDLRNKNRFYYLGQNLYYCGEPFNQYLFNVKTKTRHHVFGSFYGSYYSQDWDYLGNNSHLVDNKGNTIEVPENWLKIYDQSSGAGLAVDTKFNMYIIDKEGNIILDKLFDSASTFSEGLMAVTTSTRSGYINSKGEFVIECDFVPIYQEFNPPSIDYPFKEGIAVPQIKRGIYKIIDKKGKELSGETKLHSASFCSEGHILARKAAGGKFGYLDKTGKQVIPFVLDEANNFSDGFARAVLDGKDIAIRAIDRKYFFTQDLIERKIPELKNF